MTSPSAKWSPFPKLPENCDVCGGQLPSHLACIGVTRHPQRRRGMQSVKTQLLTDSFQYTASARQRRKATSGAKDGKRTKSKANTLRSGKAKPLATQGKPASKAPKARLTADQKRERNRISSVERRRKPRGLPSPVGGGVAPPRVRAVPPVRKRQRPRDAGAGRLAPRAA